MITETTRRAILGGTGLAAVALAVPALATTANAANDVSPELTRLMQAVADADAECQRYDEGVCAPASKRFHALCTQVPHVTIPSDRGNYWRTSNPDAIKAARHYNKFVAHHDDRAIHRALLAAHLEREEALDRIRQQTGIDEHNARVNTLCDAVAEAQEQVAIFPCATAADLHAKISFMIEKEMEDGIPRLEQILTDAARLANKEG